MTSHATNERGDVAIVGNVAVWNSDLVADLPLSHADSLRGRWAGHVVSNHFVQPESDSLLGVILRQHGPVEPIRIPPQLLGQQIATVRIAAGDRGRWHVMFVMLEGKPLFDSPGDAIARITAMRSGISAQLWYAVYDGTGWHSVRRVGVATNADLAFGPDQDFAVSGDDVAFAYSVMQDGRERVILLHSQSGQWRSDTSWIRTWIQHVQVLNATAGSGWWIAVAHMQVKPPAATAIYLSRFDSTWGPEQLIVRAERNAPVAGQYGTSTTGVSHPVLLLAAGGLLATRAVPRSATGVAAGHISMARVDLSGASAPSQSITITGNAASALGFSAASLSDSTILWLFSPEHAPQHVGVALLTPHGVMDLGSLPVNASRVHDIIAVRNGTVVYLTADRKSSATASPMVTVRNTIAIVCRARAD